MRKYIKRLKARISLNKKQFITYSILRTLVILTAVRCIFTRITLSGRMENVKKEQPFRRTKMYRQEAWKRGNKG